MSTTMRTGPEKPRHIDDRITHLSDDDLIDAFGRPRGVHDLSSLRTQVAASLRAPAWPLTTWAEATLGSTERAAIVAEARPLLTGVDVTGAGLGRSRRYGFHYLGWLEPAVRAWLLTGEERYLAAFGRHLTAWAAARDGVQGEWPGLDVIWYSLGTWARCSRLLPVLHATTSSPLDDRSWATIVATLVGGARWAYDEHDAFRHGNWQLVSATELMHIGAVLPGLIESAAWRRRGRERVEEHLALDVYPDGGHYERSPGYHAMCVGALQVAAAVDLRYSEGSLAADPRFTAMHRWLVQLADDAGWVPHLQDSGIVWPAELLLTGGYLLLDADLVRRARRWLPEDVFVRRVAALPPWDDAGRQHYWESLTGADDSQPVAAPGLRTVLPYSGYTVLRSGPHADALRMVINHGPHIEHELESHSHRSALDVVLEWHGRPLLWEAGGPPSYDDEEYLTWFQAGRGHNTITVDELELANDRRVTVDASWELSPLTGWAGSCSSGPQHHHRELIMTREEPYVVLISDQAHASPGIGHRYALHLHSPAPWTPHAPGAHDSVTERHALRVIDLNADADTTVDHTQGRARIPDPATRLAEYGPLHSLTISRSVGRFRTLLLPTTTQAPTAMASDGVVRIEHPAGDDTVIDVIGPRSWVRTRQGAAPVLRWACGWDTTVLDVDGVGRVETSVPCRILVETPAGDGATVTVEAPSRCTVRLVPSTDAARAEGSAVVLNGIRVPCGHDGAAMVVGLPFAGTWMLSQDGVHG